MLPPVANVLRATYDTGRTRPVTWRLKQLRAIKRMLEDNRDAWVDACEASTMRPRAECELGDVIVAQQELDAMIANLNTWTAPEERSTPLALMPASSRVEKQPYGATLVIGPCNYPLMLSICPMAGAVAAGNTVLLKPSELCPEVGDLFASLVKSYLDDDAVKVVLGGKEVVAALLDQKWDHIIFTGSERVGRIVAAAAAKHLTPTTLELGGKCPVFIDPNGCEPLSSVAYKLVFGRLYAGGQSCIAPEYVLALPGTAKALADEVIALVKKVHGEDPQASAHFGRLSCRVAAERIGRMLVGHGGTVLCGGTSDPAKRYVAPTVIFDPCEDAPIMNSEVFGPVLVFVTVSSMDAAIEYVRRRPGTPLALYGFTSDSRFERQLLEAIPSGTAHFNDVVAHFCNPNVPFGGLGTSGHGSLHGKFYFDACHQARGVMTKGTGLATRLLDMQVLLRAAPYNLTLIKALGFVLIKLPVNLPPQYGYKAFALAVLALLLTAIRSSGMHLVWMRQAAHAVLALAGPE